MNDLLEFVALEISDRELDRLLDAAEEFCRRGGDIEFDRRHRERYVFDREVIIQRATATGEPVGEAWRARARDISLWGISLKATGTFARHDRLTVDLTIPHSGEPDRRARMLVEVRHTKLDPAQGLILGCAFRESLDPATMERAISDC